LRALRDMLPEYVPNGRGGSDEGTPAAAGEDGTSPGALKSA
jgi:hypothetical protein